MQVPCGGGHRSWDFQVSPSQVAFVFIKEKYIYENKIDVHWMVCSTLLYPFHSKSICRCRFVGLKESLILNGSEDTTMRLSRLLDQCKDKNKKVVNPREKIHENESSSYFINFIYSLYIKLHMHHIHQNPITFCNLFDINSLRVISWLSRMIVCEAMC